MKRTIALLALATLTACQTDRRPPLGPQSVLPTFIQGFDPDGRATMTTYAGRTSAGAGQLSDTSEAEIIKALAEKIQPGTPFAYSHIVKSDVVQPNVETVEKLEADHKDALAAVAKAAAGGVAGDLSKAEDFAKIAGKRLLDRINAGKGGPKPDSGANSARLLAVGPDSGLTAVATATNYKDASVAKTRASYGSETSTKTTDTTKPEDYEAATKAMLEARLAFEARNKVHGSPVAQPPITIPVPFPSPVSTNQTPAVTTGTNVVETIQLPVIE